MPRMPSVPLIRARPSLAVSVSGSIDAAASASAAGTRSPAAVQTSPSPISARPQWASGARSPLAPSEPCSGTTGSSPAASSASIVSATIGRAPERPIARERARRNIIARTTSRSTGGPMPAACERIRARWSSSRRSGGIQVPASEPKPVETPYTGSSERRQALDHGRALRPLRRAPRPTAAPALRGARRRQRRPARPGRRSARSSPSASRPFDHIAARRPPDDRRGRGGLSEHSAVPAHSRLVRRAPLHPLCRLGRTAARPPRVCRCSRARRPS